MTTRNDVEKLAVEDLCELLSRCYREEIGEETIEAIRANRMSGRSLLELTEKELAELVPLLGDRKAVRCFIDSYSLSAADVLPQVHIFVQSGCASVSILIVLWCGVKFANI